MFLEAETRHCKIKINCQGLFAIQIPISEEAEGAGKGEYMEGQVRYAALLSVGRFDHDTHFPSLCFWIVLESFVLWGHDSLLQKES